MSVFFCSVLLVSFLRAVSSLQEWDVTPTYSEVNPGSDAVLQCLVKNKVGECRWEKDGEPVGMYEDKYEWAGDADTGDCSIRIRHASIEYDNGVWQCQVTASSFKHRDTLVSDGAELVVRVPPTEVKMTQVGEPTVSGEIVAVAGGDVVVECESRGGNPAPSVSWLLGREEVRGEERKEKVGEGEVKEWRVVSRITLPVTKLDNGKTLSCQSVNDALVSPLSVATTLNVHYAPTVSILSDASPIMLEEGEEAVSLKCLVEANPPATVRWSRSSAGGTVELSEEQDITISPVTRNTAGLYTCTARNEVGLSDPATLEVEVQYGPSRVTVEPVSSVLATTGSSLVLTCSSDGVPAPSYQWIQASPGGEELVRGYQKELVVETVSYQHQGRFYCRAVNTVRGQERRADSRPVNVTVTGPPQITRFTRQHEKQVETGEDASIDVEFCANPSPKQSWHLGDETANIILAAGTRHGRFVAEQLRPSPSAANHCYIASLRILGTHQQDSRSYRISLENEHGSETHSVRLLVTPGGPGLSREIFIAIVVGVTLTLLLLGLTTVYMVKAGRCCGKRHEENNLKQADLESEKTEVESTHSSILSGVLEKTAIPPDALYYCTREGTANNTDKRAFIHDALFNDSKEQLRPDLLPTNLNRSNSSSGEINTGKKVTYNELCFPKSSNYGSMKKKKQRNIGVECKLNARPQCPSPGQFSAHNSCYQDMDKDTYHRYQI